MKFFLKSLFTVILLFPLFLLAQQTEQTVEMADALRASGKIYVVVAVLSLIFIGIIVFLISIERKVARLEKKILKEK